MCLWRVLVKSDSRWLSASCQYSAIHKAYLTSLHSDTICPCGIQVGSIHQAQTWVLPENKLGALITTDRCVSCTNKQGSRITLNSRSDLTASLHVQHKIGRKTTKRHVADGFRQRTGRNNLNRHVVRKLDYTSRFVRVLPALSADIVHTTQ